MSQDNQAKDISRPHHGYAKSNSSVGGFYECTINAHRIYSQDQKKEYTRTADADTEVFR